MPNRLRDTLTSIGLAESSYVILWRDKLGGLYCPLHRGWSRWRDNRYRTNGSVKKISMQSQMCHGESSGVAIAPAAGIDHNG